MALTKADLADTLADSIGMDRRDAKDFVETLFESVRESLAQGEDVKISGFGNWQLRDKKQRPGRNPKTGEEIPITPRRVVSFKAGQKLRDRVGKADIQEIEED